MHTFLLNNIHTLLSHRILSKYLDTMIQTTAVIVNDPPDLDFNVAEERLARMSYVH